jgi:DNA-directed RNA polymerase specialized sigma24 family protein
MRTLLDNHRAFLRYLERRVGDRTLAEDILQDAFARTVARRGDRRASGQDIRRKRGHDRE